MVGVFMKTCITDDMVNMAEDPKIFLEHIKHVLDNDSDLYHLGIEYPWLGFMEDYKAIAKAIPKNNIVIDVGCAAGFQQVFFKDHHQYVGITDSTCGEKSLQKNAVFIIGEFKDVIDHVLRNVASKITEDFPFHGKRELFGIANMSILYDIRRKSNLIKFKEVFNRCFIR